MLHHMRLYGGIRYVLVFYTGARLDEEEEEPAVVVRERELDIGLEPPADTLAEEEEEAEETEET